MTRVLHGICSDGRKDSRMKSHNGSSGWGQYNPKYKWDVAREKKCKNVGGKRIWGVTLLRKGGKEKMMSVSRCS